MQSASGPFPTGGAAMTTESTSLAECIGPKILYIAGWGRSGTTLFDNILGQLDGFFSGGELRYVWEGRLCGCGVLVSECEIWSEVLDDAFGADEKFDPSEMADI